MGNDNPQTTGSANAPRGITRTIAAVAGATIVLLFGLLLWEHHALAKEEDLASRTRAAFKAALDASEHRNKDLQGAVAACKQTPAAKTEHEGERALLNILQQPDAHVIALAPAQQAGARGFAVMHAASHALVVSGSGLKPIPGLDYEIWLLGGKLPPRAGGFLKPGPDGVAVATVDPKALAEGMPGALSVSIEPTGGKASPSKVILIAKLP